jgi:hypothetical protein
LIEEKGVLETVSIKELEMQRRVLCNYFSVLKDWYGSKWPEKDNLFVSAAGFTAAVAFFKNKLIPYCNANFSYRPETIRAALILDSHSLFARSDYKGLQGRAAVRKISEKLTELFSPPITESGKIQI